MSPDKHYKGTDFSSARQEPGPKTTRKITPIVKARGFEFRICELVSSQKVEGKRGGGAIEQRWRIVGVFNTHVGAKNALAAIEEDERLFRTERAEVSYLCGHTGSLDHKAPHSLGGVELATLRTQFDLRNERAKGMPCLRCFCEMAAAGQDVAIENAPAKWHALLNAPNDWRVVDAPPKKSTSEDCPEECTECRTPMRAVLVPGQSWCPCTDCGGSLCEKCCEAKKTAPPQASGA